MSIFKEPQGIFCLLLWFGVLFCVLLVIFLCFACQITEITTGKNQNAQRNFALNIFTSAILNEQKKLLEELEINSEYVFCDKWGESIKNNHYYKRWIAYCDYHNMPPVTPYELRHTFVSAVKSLPEGYLKRLVGHSKDMDTYGVYSHEMDGDMSETAALVQGIFSQILAG